MKKDLYIHVKIFKWTDLESVLLMISESVSMFIYMYITGIRYMYVYMYQPAVVYG